MKISAIYFCFCILAGSRSARAVNRAPGVGVPVIQSLRAVRPAAVWTSREFIREAVRTHLESSIFEDQHTVNSAPEVGRFLRATLAARGQSETMFPKVAAEPSRKAVPELEKYLKSLFDGGVAHSEFSRDGVSLSWDRANRNHFGYLTMTGKGRVETRFTVHAPGGKNPRIQAFEISVNRAKVHFNLNSTVVLSQDIARQEPVRLSVLLSPDSGGTIVRLWAKLAKTSKLMNGQAERAAKLALRLMRLG